MTELTDQERAVLKALADEWDSSGPPGFLETAAIAQALRITVPDAKAVIHSLFVKGMAGTDKVEIFAAYLTPEGYALARTSPAPLT